MAGARKRINWQPPMLRVLAALAPLTLSGIYFFGWRTLALLLAVNAASAAAEWLFTRRSGEPVSSAVFVTATLYTLSLPPALPVPMAVLGAVFGVVFGKMVFGGFGRNVFNPALTGRAFVYVCFGNHLTARWTEPYAGPLGGLAGYARLGADALTTATPGMVLKSGGAFDLGAAFFGAAPGVIGGSAALALLGGAYLLWTRTANFRIVLPGFLAFLAVQTALWRAGVPKAAAPLPALLSGSFILGMLFYATDPVSAAQTNPGRWLYGALIGALSALIAVYSAWPAGTMFAILLANTFAPIMDYAIRAWQARQRQPAPQPKPAAPAP